MRSELNAIVARLVRLPDEVLDRGDPAYDDRRELVDREAVVQIALDLGRLVDKNLPGMVPGRGAGSVQAEDGGDTESTSSLVSDEAGGRGQGAGSVAARPRRDP